MMSRTQAEAKALSIVISRDPDSESRGFHYAIADAIEKPYGWIIFYTSREYLEGNQSASLYGNWPLLIYGDGSYAYLGFAWENAIKEIEERIQ